MAVVRDADRLRALWSQGGTGTGLWSALDDPVVAELLASGPSDYVVLDLQHGFASLATLPRLCTAMRAGGRAPLVRVPWNEPAGIMRAIDAGASGVVVPMVGSAAEAAAAVAASSYPPGGLRSWGPFGTEATGLPAGTPAEQDAAVLRVVMVETAAGIGAVEEIAATPGVDVVYVGPNDLALTTGHGRGTYRDTPAVAAMLDRVAAACAAAGTVAGLHCRDVAMAAEWAARGFRMLTVAQDSALLRTALDATWEQLRRPATEESLQLAVLVDRPAGQVYAFARDPANLPLWAPGLGTDVVEVDGRWFVETPQGRAQVTFAPENAFGVLDHDVVTPSGSTVHVPLRVVDAGAGCEVVFTLRREPGMTDAELARDAGLVRADLARLKAVMESR